MSGELVPQLYPSEYDNLTMAGASMITDSTFGWCSAINNTGTVFAIGANRKVFVYTSNATSTTFRSIISDPEGNPSSVTYFGSTIAIDAAGDTLIIGSRGNNRAYVFDTIDKNRQNWTQRKNNFGSPSYISPQSPDLFGASVDVADDDDTRFIIGNPGQYPKVEIVSWPKDSAITTLTILSGNHAFGYSCKLSGDGKVAIIGAPGAFNPSVQTSSTAMYESGIVYVYEEPATGFGMWNTRAMPWGTQNIPFPDYVETQSSEFSNIKRVTNTSVENGGTKIRTLPAFGHSVAINKDGSIIAASAPGRQCFFSAKWEQTSTSSALQYVFMTEKPIVNTSIGFGATLHMNYDGTRIVIGNGFVEDTVYWDYDDPTTVAWQIVSQGSPGNNGNGAGPSSYNLMDWNGKNWVNFHEDSESKEFGGLPTSISKNGEFVIFSALYYYGTLYANANRQTGSDRSWSTGSTVFTFKRFPPTIKMLGKTSLGGDLDCTSLTLGGDTSYLDANTTPGKLIFNDPVTENGLFESSIQNTSRYTGDIHKTELLIYKSGHVRGSNTHGPDRIRIKAPTICLEGMVFENNPTGVDARRQVWSPAGQDFAKTLKEASGIYNRLTLTGLGNVGIGVPEFDDTDIKENAGLDITTLYPDKRLDKTHENPNTHADPLINHRLVVAGSQDIQGGKLFINSYESSNVIVDGLSTHYNTMSKHCFFEETGTTYCKNEAHERNPWWQFYNKTYTATKHRYQLNLTLSSGGSAYNDTYKALVFNSSHIDYANGRLMSVYCPITGDQLGVVNQGINTISYWFMPLKSQTSFNNMIFGQKNPDAGVSDSISHIVTSSSFMIKYTNAPSYGTYLTSYTFDQNKWYHICVKYDNTPGNGGTATTQLWINGISQTLTAQGVGVTDLWDTVVYGTITRYYVTFMDDAYFGNIPGGAGFQTGYPGTSDYAIGNFKHYIATDGSSYAGKRVVPDYNTATDLYNEGPPDQVIIADGFIKSRGLSALGNNNLTFSISDSERLAILSTGELRVNGSVGTSGQVLTSSGAGSAPTWTSVSGGSTSSTVWSTSGTNVHYNNGNVGIGTTNPNYKLHVAGTSNFTGELSVNGSVGTSGQVLTSSGAGSAPTWTTVSSSYWTTSGSSIYYNTGNIGIGITNPAYHLDVAGDINFTGELSVNGSVGTSGQVLTSSGPGSAPTWTTVSSSYWTQSGSSIYYTNGNVGIGTTNPNYKLHVAGTSNFTNAIYTNGSAGLSGQVLTSTGPGSAPTWTTVSGGGGGSSYWTQSSLNIYYTTGNVGISNTNPNYKLSVAGDIYTSSEGGFRGNGRNITGINITSERNNTIINFGQQSSLKQSINGDPF